MPIFSDYGDIPDISSRLSIPSLVFSIVTPLVVLARCVARSAYSNQLGLDDWTVIASLIFAEVICIQMIICCKWGFGKHTWQIPQPVVGKTLELYFFAQILYKINIGLTKLSILLFYLRVFSIYRWFRTLCWTVAGIVVVFTLATVFGSIFQCRPVEFAFNKKVNGGHGTCIDLTAFWFANAAFNISSDLVIIVMPTVVVRTLQLPKRSKIALCSVFAVGGFVCVTSILRITTLNIATSHTDTMWQSINSSMWTIIESNLGIICASMPALKRPLSFLFPWLFAKVTRTDNYRYGNSAGIVQGSATFFNQETAISYARGARGTLRSTKCRQDGVDGFGTELHDLQEMDDRSRRESQDPILKAPQGKSLGGILHTTELNIEYNAKNDPFGDAARYTREGS